MNGRYFILFSLFTASLCGQWNAIGPSTVTPRIAMFSEQGSVVLQTREFLVQGTPNKGRPDRGEILLYYDPGTRYFLWRFAPALTFSNGTHTDFDKPWLGDINATEKVGAIFAAHDGVFLFEAFRGAIHVTGSAGTASSLDDAQTQALRLLAADFDRVEGLGRARPTWTQISCPEVLARVAPASIYRIQIESVSRQQASWQIIVHHYDMLIRLDVDSSWRPTAATILSTTKK